MVKDLHICLNMAGDSGWMGGIIYIQNLVRAIAHVPAEEKGNLKLSIVASNHNFDLVKPVSRYLDAVYLKRGTYLKVCKSLAERFSFLPRQWLNPLQLDFFYPTTGGNQAPFTWGGWIPDFQHHYLPQLYSEAEIQARDAHHRKIAETAPVVILSSKMAQADFQRLYPEAANRSQLMNFVSYLEPAWLQPTPQFTQIKYQLPDEFFLVSNQFWEHKNHGVIIEALGILKQQGIKPVVVCTGKTTGQNNTEYFDQLLGRIEALNLGAQIRILGLIPRIDQIQLMRRCLAVIQPSLFEGWSTVIEDARALGKPIIASDFPVHLEQNPPHSYFFAQHNPEQLATLIAQSLVKLKPGPDFTAEEHASHNNYQQLLAYGRRFLKIVRNTV